MSNNVPEDTNDTSDIGNESANLEPKRPLMDSNPLVYKLFKLLGLLPTISLLGIAGAAYILLRSSGPLAEREYFGLAIFTGFSIISFGYYLWSTLGREIDDKVTDYWSRATPGTRLCAMFVVASLVLDSYVLLNPNQAGKALNDRELTSIIIFSVFGGTCALYYFWVSFARKRVETRQLNSGVQEPETARWLALSVLSIFSGVIVMAYFGTSFSKFSSDAQKSFIDVFRTSATVAGTLITTVIGYYFGSEQSKKSQKNSDDLVKVLDKSMDKIQPGS